MNTLSKTVTASFFCSPDGFRALERRWSEIVNSPEKKSLSAADYLLYQALRGKDWRRGLTPIGLAPAENATYKPQRSASGEILPSRPRTENRKGNNKLANGGVYTSGITYAYRALSDHRWGEFVSLIGGGIIDPEALKTLRSLIPSASPNTLPAMAYIQQNAERLTKTATELASSEREAAHV